VLEKKKDENTCPDRGHLNHLIYYISSYIAQREETTYMSNTWITPTEAATIISKNSHHAVSQHHVQTLIQRGKIGMRTFPDGTQLLKRSHVESTRVATGTGNLHRGDRGIS
jgi:alpha-D-ribose 1-methylphosphonate 5-triphosphate diphosphatase PhnM